MISWPAAQDPPAAPAATSRKPPRSPSCEGDPVAPRTTPRYGEHPRGDRACSFLAWWRSTPSLVLTNRTYKPTRDQRTRIQAIAVVGDCRAPRRVSACVLRYEPDNQLLFSRHLDFPLRCPLPPLPFSPSFSLSLSPSLSPFSPFSLSLSLSLSLSFFFSFSLSANTASPLPCHLLVQQLHRVRRCEQICAEDLVWHDGGALKWPAPSRCWK